MRTRLNENAFALFELVGHKPKKMQATNKKKSPWNSVANGAIKASS